MSAGERVVLGSVVFLAAALLALPAAAGCVADSIGDHGPGADTRFTRCLETERRLEALERAERQRQEEARQQQDEARRLACIKFAKNGDYLDCINRGNYKPPPPTKAQIEAAQRHLWSESETPEFKARVDRCVEEQRNRMQQSFESRQTINKMGGPNCVDLTPVEGLIASLRGAELLSEMIQEHDRASKKRR
jgi:hypothetical protein